MSRTMPLAGDYAAAVQNPGFCFTDEVLRGSVIRKNNLGQPRAMSGQFSVVFPMTSPDGQRHAVKCFTHDAPNQLRRYELIYQGLSRLRPRWATDFAYREDGIQVEGETYPVLRMDWVEGTSLLTWLIEHRDGADIRRLADGFDRLVRELSDEGIAHGDLQHGNILVQPDGSLRLIDYDGIYLPGVGLEEYPSQETGLPGYQPPGRTAADYGPAMDRFSAWLIALSLTALAADPSLLEALNPDRGEYLLLDRDDLADPWSSAPMALLDEHENPVARELAERVRVLLSLPLGRMPALDAPWSYDGLVPERPPDRPRPVPAPRKSTQQVPAWLAGVRPMSPAVPRPQAPAQPGPRTSSPRPQQNRPLSRRTIAWITASLSVFVVLICVVGWSEASRLADRVLPPGTDFLLSNGRVFDMGSNGLATVVDSSGKRVGSGTGGVTSLTADTSPYSVPQLANRCVVVRGRDGTVETMTLDAGYYYTFPGETGEIVNGHYAAWSDGSIRDACSVGTAGFYSNAGEKKEPECLISNDLVLTQSGSYAHPRGIRGWWEDGRNWARTGAYNAVCDAAGTAVLLDRGNNAVSRINPKNGKTYWTAPAVPGITDSKDPVRMFETQEVVLLSAPGTVLAYDKQTGKALWSKNGACALAVRSSSRAEALLGPCTYRKSTDTGRAEVINPETGAVTRTLQIGDYDQWTANAKTLLAVNTKQGNFREVNW